MSQRQEDPARGGRNHLEHRDRGEHRHERYGSVPLIPEHQRYQDLGIDAQEDDDG